MGASSDASLEMLLDLHGIVYRLDLGFWVKFKAYLVPPNEHIPHGVSYSLTLHDAGNHRIFGIDNVHAYAPKNKRFGGRKTTWDHSHNRERVTPYEFESAGQLLSDFWQGVEEIISRLNTSGDKSCR
jgi:hypothetical protein